MKSLLLAVLLGGAAFGQQAITISSTSPLTAANLGRSEEPRLNSSH